jgi:hypothetical protein
MGVTAQRVRQREARAKERLRQAITEPALAPLRWRAHSLRNLVGLAVPVASEHLENSLIWVTRDVSEPGKQRVRDLLLWIAGPYQVDTETRWCARAELPGPETVDTFLEPEGDVDLDRLAEWLGQSGLVPAVHQEWLVQIAHATNFHGRFLVGRRSPNDKAAILLKLWGRPATVEELVGAIGAGDNPLLARKLLLRDRRFAMLADDRIRLRAASEEP